MWKGCAIVLVAMLTGSVVGATAQDGWIRIGKSGIGPWQVYVKQDSVRKDSKGYVHVQVLEDHRVTIQGVDRFDADGNISNTDTRYPHRSTVATYVLDCARREEVFLRIDYYSGDMATGRIVLEEKEREPYWSDILFDLEPTLTRFACNPKNHAE
jgi:hypothetical protein